MAGHDWLYPAGSPLTQSQRAYEQTRSALSPPKKYMQTKTIIQQSCNVIRITSLAKGNIYKRVDDTYGATVKYGVVLDLFNTGEKTFIQTLEYTTSYRNVDAEIKVFKGDDDLAIFPATKDEIEEYFSSAISGLRKSIEDKKKELQEAENGLNRALEFTNGELTKQLVEVEFKEIGQVEYNEKVKSLKEANEISF